MAGCRARGSSSTISRPATHTFHPLPPSRAVRRSADGLGARAHDGGARTRASAPRSSACAGGIDDKIVRLVVRDVPRHIARELDHKALREFKRRALHFHLDTRRPEIIRSVGARRAGPAAVARRHRARQAARARRAEPTSIATRSSTLGLRYLREAEERDVRPRRSAPSVGALDEAQQPPAHELPPARRHVRHVRHRADRHHRPERLRARRRSSRRSRGRCTATPRRAATRDSIRFTARRPARARAAWSSTSSSAAIAIASCAGSRTPSSISTAPTRRSRTRITGVTRAAAAPARHDAATSSSTRTSRGRKS